MIPTPDLSHLTKEDLENVYDPAEDTFALLDALEADQDAIRAINARLCLEIGSGSGCVSAFLATIIGSTSAAFLCTDINPHATRATEQTGRQNKAYLEPILTSLHYPLLQRLQQRVDMLLFNPPYVPTEDEEGDQSQLDAGITAAWAGGQAGMLATNLLLRDVPALLSEKGRFYLVAVQQNKPQAIIAGMVALGMKGEVALKRRAGGEVLYILRFTRVQAS